MPAVSIPTGRRYQVDMVRYYGYDGAFQWGASAVRWEEKSYI